MANGRDWSNLACQVRERREELGLTQEDVAQKGGPSTATQREIERAKPMRKRPSSYRNLEKALELREGSALRALRGDRVQRLEDPVPEPPQEDPGHRPDIAWALEYSAWFDSLTPAEQDAERESVRRQARGEDEPKANGPARRAG